MALGEGFDVMAVTPASVPAETSHRLHEFISRDFQGQMSWMAETASRRQHPKAMWPGARTAIMMGCNYGPSFNPLDQLAQTENANISVYARGRDYHDVLKGRLKQIASRLAARTGWQVKVFVDTAPLMEKPLAAQAGIGWQGKHTNLVSRDYGSWLFLGSILTDGVLGPDTPSDDHCGSCTACLDICPTDAFPAPYQLDARRCISYLTIEYSGHIPLEFRGAMGNRIFGCDDCLAVCPWNKFASDSQDIKLGQSQNDPLTPLSELLRLDDDRFRKRYTTTPVRRVGYIRFMRNVLIASGNARSSELVPVIKPYLEHEDPRLRAMAVWALSCYLSDAELSGLRPDDEADAEVISEWKRACDRG